MKTWMYWALAAVAVGGAAYYLYYYKKKSERRERKHRERSRENWSVNRFLNPEKVAAQFSSKSKEIASRQKTVGTKKFLP